MPAEYFLEISTEKGGKVKGETTIQGFKEQIQIKRFSLGISSPTDSATLRATHNVEQEFAEFEYITCTASTALFQALSQNDTIKTATLSCRRAGGKIAGLEIIYLKWIFQDARMVSFRNLGSDQQTTDVIQIAYGKVEIQYKQQKPDGTLGPESSASHEWGEN